MVFMSLMAEFKLFPDVFEYERFSLKGHMNKLIFGKHLICVFTLPSCGLKLKPVSVHESI